MGTTRVYLVRHGATRVSAEDCFAGAIDVELSDEGRTQAERLAESLSDEALSAVYASPMQRTMATADILAKPHGLTTLPRDALREIHHGRWEGLRRAEVEERFRDEYLSWEEDPFTFAPQDGESGLAVMARALPVLREVVRTHAGEQILVVSHKATIRLLLSSLLGFDPRGYRDRLDQLPCCLNIIDFKDPTRARLRLFNDVSHYARRLEQPGERLSKWWGSGRGA